MIWNGWADQPLEVLLVEDDPLETEMMYDFLQGTGVTMWRENRLSSALENLAEHRYDLILLDTTLPDADEMESLAGLRRAAPQTPVLMIGYLNGDGLARQVVRAGAQDYLYKPDLNRNSLLRALTYAKERQALQSEADALRARAEALARRKEQFASMVSHEILNPLSGLLGFARLMDKTELNPKQREYLSVISECTSSLSVLVTDLLEFSRLQEGRESARRESFSLLALADELGTFLGQEQMGSELRLLLVCDPAIPSQVQGDRVKVRQILYNLAQNALKFTETGHVALRMRLLFGDEGAVRVRLMVEDTGRGIPEEKRAEIFEPFTQVHGKDRARGHGLGLAICSQLARVLGGELKMMSELGQGTIFWTDLCFAVAPQAIPVGRALEGKSVLAISDYEPERLAFQEILESLGARVQLEAPDRLRAGTFDMLVVSDHDARCLRVLEATQGKVSRRLLMSTSSESVAHPECEILTAPLRLSQLITAPSQAKPDKVASNPMGRALVVEDDPVCRVYLTHLLSHLGFEVDTAGDATTAYNLVASRKYKAITLDGHLPGSDGPAVYRTMMSQGWIAPETQVLVVSGDPGLWRGNFREGDRLHLLTKPVCPDRVQDILCPQPELSGRWDEQRVRSLEGLGAEAARVLFEVFEQSVPAVLELLDQAVMDRCSHSVRKLSHQVRGAASSVGACVLAAQAGALETAEDTPEQWETLLQEIHKEFVRSTDDIKARPQRSEVRL